MVSARSLRLVVVVVLAFLALVPGSAALADKPIRNPLPIPIEGIVISDECAFDVLFEGVSNKEKETMFVDKEGEVRLINITGVLKVRFTNLETDKSIVRNISGPLRVEPQADDSAIITYRGASGLFFPPNDSSLPPIAFTHGPVVTKFDAEGNFSVISVKGRVQNVCAMLD